MAFPLAAAIGIAVGANVLGGIRSSNISKSNAQNAYNAQMQNAYAAQNAARQNANLMMSVGAANASMIGAVGRQNAALQTISANMQADSLEQVSLYNIALQRQVTQYNVSLLENQLPQLYNAYDLDVLRLEQAAARTEGSIVAYQAASGVLIGEGSPADVVIDSRSQAALDKTVLRHNLNVKAADINNAIARSQWEGQVAMQKLGYETRVQSYNTRAQGALNAAGIMGQAALDAGTTMINSMAGAYSALNQGQAQAITYESAGRAAYNTGMNNANQQLWGGILNGISSGATMFAAGYQPAAAPTATIAPSRVAPYAINYRPTYSSPGSSLLA